jgi:starch phosphorylase
MRESMAQLTPQFSANRTVREYTEQHYIPAAAAYRERAADNGAKGAQLVNWQHDLEQKWGNLRFGEIKVASNGGNYVFEVQVYLSGLDPNTVRVELYADGVDGKESVRQEMIGSQELADASSYIYRTEVASTRPATDYTARVVPYYSGVAIPLEEARILWQR